MACNWLGPGFAGLSQKRQGAAQIAEEVILKLPRLMSGQPIQDFEPIRVSALENYTGFDIVCFPDTGSDLQSDLQEDVHAECL